MQRHLEIDDDIAPPVGFRGQSETETVERTMKVLKCSRSTVYRLIDEGELLRIKVFGKTLILGLHDFIERKAAEARKAQAN